MTLPCVCIGLGSCGVYGCSEQLQPEQLQQGLLLLQKKQDLELLQKKQELLQKKQELLQKKQERLQKKQELLQKKQRL
jgi:mitogen-activated protein kinase kinase kinase kinase 4